MCVYIYVCVYVREREKEKRSECVSECILICVVKYNVYDFMIVYLIWVCLRVCVCALVCVWYECFVCLFTSLSIYICKYSTLSLSFSPPLSLYIYMCVCVCVCVLFRNCKSPYLKSYVECITCITDSGVHQLLPTGNKLCFGWQWHTAAFLQSLLTVASVIKPFSGTKTNKLECL